MTAPTNSFVPSQDPGAFRQALGAFATGVTVVTTAGQAGPVGITVNSFASVSLAPPLVLWSLDKSSNRYETFNAAPHFAIHVLDIHQKQICDGFVRPSGGFDGLNWQTDAHGVPLINGCLARFECTLFQRIEAGDHIILIGQVHQAERRDGMPLLFQGGRFVSLKG